MVIVRDGDRSRGCKRAWRSSHQRKARVLEGEAAGILVVEEEGSRRGKPRNRRGSRGILVVKEEGSWRGA